MHFFLTFFVILSFFVHELEFCIATSPTTTPSSSTVAPSSSTNAPSDCQSCLLSATQIILISLGAKDFTSDTIDTSGTCAVRTSVCTGFSAGAGVMISYNRDVDGIDSGVDSVTSTLICNSAGQWTKNSVPILEIECQSTP